MSASIPVQTAEEEAEVWAAAAEIASGEEEFVWTAVAIAAATAGRCWGCYQPTTEKDKTPTNLPMCEKCYEDWNVPTRGSMLLEGMSAAISIGMKK